MSHTVTLIPGDGTGPEIIRGLVTVLEATGVAFSWDEKPLTDGAITDEALESIRTNRVALMGYQLGHREDPDRLPPVAELRKALGLYANHRPVKTIAGIPARFQGVNLLVVRETSEDIYAHLEHESLPGVYESLKVTTKSACERIAIHAFETARAQGRKKVTIVHKANILKMSDGLFLRTAREVAAKYPDIEADDCIVDALCMKLTLDPTRFDVLVCGNLYGDIVSDLAAGLVGGRSNSPSVNVGGGLALFTAGHGGGPDLVGTGKANPLSLLFASVRMLRHLNEADAADRLMSACKKALAVQKPMALGGDLTCEAFLGAVVASL